MPEDGSADRPSYEPDRIDGKGLQRADQRIGMGKEQLGENEPSDRAVKEKIVPLDGRANRAGNNGAAQLNAVLIFGQARNCDLSHGSRPPPIQPLKERGLARTVPSTGRDR